MVSEDVRSGPGAPSGDDDPRNRDPADGHPRYLFSVRNSLIAISAVLTGLLIWLTAVGWYQAYAERRDADQILASAEIAGRMADLGRAWAHERVLTHVALNNWTPASDDAMAAIGVARDAADAGLAQALSVTRGRESSDPKFDPIRVLGQTAAGLDGIRKSVDAALTVPLEERDATLLGDWFPMITDLIMETETIKRSIQFRPDRIVADIDDKRVLDQAVFDMSEYAERERAIVAGVIAADDPLILDEIERLSTYRGHFEAAWQLIERYAEQGRAAGPIANQIKNVRDAYFGTFELLRAEIIRAGMEGAEYPLSLTEWLSQSGAAIAPIRDMGRIAATTSDQSTAALSAHATRRLVVGSAILLIAVIIGATAFWIVVIGIARPLNLITGAMTRLAQGDQAVDVPCTDRGSEIGDMARAVQVFKQTVDRKSNEIADINADLQRLNDNLESMVRQRTAEAESARDAAIEANQAKSVFVANMSHELRTPLNAIIGYSELLSEAATDYGHKDYLPDLSQIRSAGRHLLDLINHVLDLSKIEAGKIDIYYEEFDIADMVENVSETIKPLSEANENTLEISCPSDIGLMTSDLTKIRQIIINLLSNACKFTEAGLVRFGVSRHERNDTDMVVFTVSDTGIGMSRDHIDKVFDAFTQADSSTTRQYGGTGLGLAITKSFCTILGGDLSVVSELGKGSTFTVQLPARSAPQQVEPLEPAVVQPAHTGSRTVLVIDDDAVVRDLLTRHLSRSGYRAISAGDGADGLSKAEAHHPDAITLDVLMPHMDGWAVLSKLKDNDVTADIPVIMVSIVDEPKLGFSLGAADYLSKPIDRDKLLAILDRICPDRRPAGRILLLEDDVAARDIMRKTAERIGWEVDEARNGREGLDRLAASVPDVIVLDLLMPVMDGFEFLFQIREDPLWRNIPVLVVTAKDLSEDDQRRLEGRIQQLIRKGDHLDEVLAALNRLLPATGHDPTGAEADLKA